MRTTNQQPALAEALAALETGVAKPVQAPRPTYAEARAALDAKFRAGDVHRTHDIKGQFNGVTRIAHFGPRSAAPVVTKVEAPRPAPRVHVPASAALSAEV